MREMMHTHGGDMMLGQQGMGMMGPDMMMGNKPILRAGYSEAYNHSIPNYDLLFFYGYFLQ
jgi:hypothetical protein